MCPQDVDLMYTELIQRCKQMYLTESDRDDDNVYQLPSFLDSIASVLIHMDRVWDNSCSLNSYLLNMQSVLMDTDLRCNVVWLYVICPCIFWPSIYAHCRFFFLFGLVHVRFLKYTHLCWSAFW